MNSWNVINIGWVLLDNCLPRDLPVVWNRICPQAIYSQEETPKHLYKNKIELTLKHRDNVFYLNQNTNSLNQILSYLADVQN